MTEPTAAPSANADTVRVHATNIKGIGAVQLAQSLLPAIERVIGYAPRTIYLPTNGPLAAYQSVSRSTILVCRAGLLPNAIWRVFECTLFSSRFDGEGSLLVLGDIPLRCKGRQTVFVQNLLLTKNAPGNRRIGALKYWFSRALFRINLRFASDFIVQTEVMKIALAKTYSGISERIHVIGQPPPGWLLDAGLKRTRAKPSDTPGLRLVYPAASYPHKNHRLLNRIQSNECGQWPVLSLILTINEELHPNPKCSWIKCVGRLGVEAMLQIYGMVDGLLFLSLAESFGFPLVEAMWIGLPIICPDLPYARLLCGSQAIYFDPYSAASLQAAVVELERRLKIGWWPDWRGALEAIPTTWDAVAASMLSVTAGKVSATR